MDGRRSVYMGGASDSTSFPCTSRRAVLNEMGVAMKDIVIGRQLTAMEQIGEQIGVDLSEASATGDYQLLHERMVANLESLEFYLDKMVGKLLLLPKEE